MHFFKKKAHFFSKSCLSMRIIQEKAVPLSSKIVD